MMPGIAVQTVGISGVPAKWAAISDRHLRRLSLNGLIRKTVSVTNTHYRKRKRAPAVLKSTKCIKAWVRSTLSRTIAADGTTLQDALESLYLRLNVTLASQHTIVKGKTVQLPYGPNEIFTLEKWGGGAEYRMVNAIEGVASHTEGYFVFIIPVDAPYKIQCAALACLEEPISRFPPQGALFFCECHQGAFRRGAKIRSTAAGFLE